jgi:ribosomal protein L7/L12
MTLWFAVAAIFLLILLMMRRKPVEHRAVNQLPPPNEEVLALIDQRRNLEAIKRYRSQHVMTLLEAKRVIDHHTQMRVRPQ